MSKFPLIRHRPDVTDFFAVLLGEDLAGVTIFPYIFTKNKDTDKNIINHEKIHYEQYKETLIIGFPIILLLNLFFNLIRYQKMNKAYRMLLFEREAYENMNNFDYLKYRRRYAWLKYMWEEKLL
jgi:hypothetical protein